MVITRLIRKSILAGIPALLVCVACGQGMSEVEPEAVPLVTVDTTVPGLVLYYPPTDSIELRCFDRPDPARDRSIVFCCAAAFTDDWETGADHARICGDHVSGGTHYQRPKLKRNTGAFVAKDTTWRFLYSPSANPNSYRPSFKNATAAFTQEMMIHQGNRVKTTRSDSNVNQFRALCLVDNRLCIADSARSMPFGDFIQLLLEAGAKEALYMDMGPGWNYSWYRTKADSAATFIHSRSLDCATNWLVFHSL